MTKKVSFIPEGFHTVTPSLIVKHAARAIEFYKSAFGATEFSPRMTDPQSGKIVHAEIKIGDSLVIIGDEFPEWGNLSPESLGGTAVRIDLYVEDVDALANQAVAAGAKVLIPVEDQFYGDRAGRLADPFGHVWVIATHKEDVGPNEMQERFEQFIKQQGSA